VLHIDVFAHVHRDVHCAYFSDTSLVNDTHFDELPILSLCHKVGELEGKSRLELVLLKPGSAVSATDQGEEEKQKEGQEQEQEQAVASPVEPWTCCMWELRLCEEVQQPPPAQEHRGEGGEAGTDSDSASPPSPVLVQTKRALCRWADSACFDSEAWHSVALMLQASGDAAGGGDTGGGGCAGNVELAVDGAGRMKLDGPCEEGVAAAWLPAASAPTATATDSPAAETSGDQTEGIVLHGYDQWKWHCDTVDVWSVLDYISIRHDRSC
jgi:hypothetical protein